VKLKCPECDGNLATPKDLMEGEIVSCPDCGLELEASFNGKGEVELKKAEIEGEDWGE